MSASDTGANAQILALQTEVASLKALIAPIRAELQVLRTREKRAHYLALHDDLTSLPNRRYFMDRLDAALLAADSVPCHFSIIFLDLDNFKTLNDTHGHDAGDYVLKTVAERLSAAASTDAFVSRLGGDEYACLVTGDTAASDLHRVAASLLRAASSPLKVGSGYFSIRASIGVSSYPSDGTTATLLMKAADVAMFSAKRNRSGIAFHAY